MGKLRLIRTRSRSRRTYLHSWSRSMVTSFRQIINKAVADKRFLVVPGAHDALSARLIQKIGFETYFIGGFPAVGARYRVLDVGAKGFVRILGAGVEFMVALDLA